MEWLSQKIKSVECRNADRGSKIITLRLPFGTCNIRRIRSLDPKGVIIMVTLVISFHPTFITKVDKAYDLQCFYMETDKQVDSNMVVSIPPSEELSIVVPMPQCRYEVLDQPEGRLIEFAYVGQPVYHKWTCESTTPSIFCMTVHSCFVDDGTGDSVELIDENGCATDIYILRNLEYVGELMAGQEAHVFKFADRSQLYFQCQVTISLKASEQECPILHCENSIRRRRSLRLEDYQLLGTSDVSFELETKDITSRKLDQGNRLVVGNGEVIDLGSVRFTPVDTGKICLQKKFVGVLYAFLAMTIIGMTATTFVIIHVCRRDHRNMDGQTGCGCW